MDTSSTRKDKEKQMKEIILNHKMNMTKREIEEYIEKWSDIKTDHHIIVCPSFLYLPYFQYIKSDLGSQDVSAYRNGPHTGEVSASQLKSLNVKYTLVGHSERRTTYQEENSQIQDKITRLKEVGITPILCVGEQQEEAYQDTIMDQLNHLDLDNVIIAYEPVYAIGTGKMPTKEKIEEVITWIKQYVKEKTKIEPKVLYGGSITAENAHHLLQSKVIDGILIGGASLSIEKIKKIVK